MSAQFTLISQQPILPLRAEGLRTPASSVALIQYLVQLSRAQCQFKTLIEDKRTGEISVIGILAILDQFETLGFTHQQQLALVLANFAEAPFLETAAVNRGWTIKCFDNVPAAQAWLKQQA